MTIQGILTISQQLRNIGVIAQQYLVTLNPAQRHNLVPNRLENAAHPKSLQEGAPHDKSRGVISVGGGLVTCLIEPSPVIQLGGKRFRPASRGNLGVYLLHMCGIGLTLYG